MQTLRPCQAARRPAPFKDHQTTKGRVGARRWILCGAVPSRGPSVSGDWQLSGPNQGLDSDPEATSQALDLAATLAHVAEDAKGQHTLILHVANLVYWTRVLVLVTVTSRPQLRAMLARMEAAALASHACTPASGPAPGKSTWELLDFGDVVVHLQTADQRAFYDLEGLYHEAEEIPLPTRPGAEESNAYALRL